MVNNSILSHCKVSLCPPHQIPTSLFFFLRKTLFLLSVCSLFINPQGAAKLRPLCYLFVFKSNYAYTVAAHVILSLAAWFYVVLYEAEE